MRFRRNDEMQSAGAVVLSVTDQHVLTTTDLPMTHSDPFDRVLIAQALARGLQLATRDPMMAAYDVPLMTV